MKAGDVCKCISNFHGELSGELILQKNDIVQIHHVIDKLWLEGEGGGSIGKFPSGIVIKTELPPHNPESIIYVAIADFAPLQEGDLPLFRGNFIDGVNAVDGDWAYGESNGKSGMFPLNFAWKINKSLCEYIESDKQVFLIGKVLTSIKAQLPEELNLWKGDTVTITHIIDEDWYRGECNGKIGILPRSFIEIIKEGDLEKSPHSQFIGPSNSAPLPDPAEVSSNNDNDINQDTSVNSGSEAKLVDLSNNNKCDPSKLSQCWKNFDLSADEKLFDDDYFKVNMPSVYTGTSHSNESADRNNDQGLSNMQSNDIDEPLISVNSLSAEVDQYFECSADQPGAIHEDLLDIDFSGVYTEDNTGINPYGRAVFSFTAKYQNELNFRKGDIIHLIRHIDSHWTVGKLGVLKGIFPTSYIDIIVDCPYKAEDNFKKRTDAIKKAIVCFDYEAVLPEDVSAKEGDVALITKFVSDSWAEIELENGHSGLIPLNYLNIFDDNFSEGCKIDESTAPLPSKRNYSKDDFGPNKTEKDIETALIQNISSLNISFKHSKLTSTQTKHVEDIFTDTKSNEPIISPSDDMGKKLKDLTNDKEQVSTTNSSARKETTKDLTSTREENVASPTDENVYANSLSTSETNHNDLYSVINKKEFPKDLKAASLQLDKRPSSDKNAEYFESEVSPQRPAPPPPLQSDSENEEYCSLSSSGEDCGAHIAKAEIEDSEEHKEISPVEGEADSKYARKLIMRRESVNELVTTEYEYIHDLESLVQVVKLGRRRKEADAVDLQVLMGNITQVIELSKIFVKELNRVSFNDDDEMLVGPVFVMMAQEICDVYKVYSSNNSISVAPLLKKYQESGGDSAIFLKWVLTELRQHKVNLLDMQAVLIKPVQRVLKYPLFIDNLVQNTPQSHPDFQNLETAKNKMLNVAKEINEYTKRLDLVAKYRHGSQHSFGEMIQRVSMRSFAKKGARFKTRISATMGLISKTKDLRFEEEEAKFRSLMKACVVLTEQGTKLIEAIRGRHKSEMAIIETISGTLSTDSKIPYIETLKNISENVYCKVFPMFEKTVMTRVINPVKKLLSMCSSPDHLIQKRYDKLLDYDKAQHKLDKNKDPARTRILEEELKIAQGTYEALNTQLLMDLPKFNEHGTSISVLALRSLIAARMNLEGHVTNFYLKLSQSNVFSYLNNEEYLSNFKSKHVDLICNLKKLQFVTAEFSPRSPKFVRRKSSIRTLGRKGEKTDKKNSSRQKLKEQAELTEHYEPTMIYIAITNHVPEDKMDISILQGALVGVIKMKDPSGSSARWFVDNGSEKGFVRSCCLQKYNVDQTPSVDKGSRSSIPSEQTLNADRDRDSISHELPPKYEDIFPSQACASSVPERNVYEEIKDVPKKLNKTKERDVNSSRSLYPTQVGNMFHRYEEIEENLRGEEPIYETIPADEEPVEMETKQVFFPEPDENEPQFFYSLYHFGGNDQNQLPLTEGQVVYLLFAQGSDWWFVEDRNGRRGYVPAGYLSKYT